MSSNNEGRPKLDPSRVIELRPQRRTQAGAFDKRARKEQNTGITKGLMGRGSHMRIAEDHFGEGADDTAYKADKAIRKSEDPKDKGERGLNFVSRMGDNPGPRMYDVILNHYQDFVDSDGVVDRNPAGFKKALQEIKQAALLLIDSKK